VSTRFCRRSAASSKPPFTGTAVARILLLDSCSQLFHASARPDTGTPARPGSACWPAPLRLQHPVLPWLPFESSMHRTRPDWLSFRRSFTPRSRAPSSAVVDTCPGRVSWPRGRGPRVNHSSPLNHRPILYIPGASSLARPRRSVSKATVERARSAQRSNARLRCDLCESLPIFFRSRRNLLGQWLSHSNWNLRLFCLPCNQTPDPLTRR